MFKCAFLVPSNVSMANHLLNEALVSICVKFSQQKVSSIDTQLVHKVFYCFALGLLPIMTGNDGYN